jgi:hypothetical protein
MTSKAEFRKTWEDHFEKAAREAAKSDLRTLEWGYPRALQQDFYQAADVHDLAGFASKDGADRHYRARFLSNVIRAYFRRNGLTTRQGSVHAFDCRVSHLRLWAVVARESSLDGLADGVRWSWRTVDGLKNLYVWFERRPVSLLGKKVRVRNREWCETHYGVVVDEFPEDDEYTIGGDADEGTFDGLEPIFGREDLEVMK